MRNKLAKLRGGTSAIFISAVIFHPIQPNPLIAPRGYIHLRWRFSRPELEQLDKISHWPIQRGWFYEILLRLKKECYQKFFSENLLICSGRVPIVVWCMASGELVHSMGREGGDTGLIVLSQETKISGNKTPWKAKKCEMQRFLSEKKEH